MGFLARRRGKNLERLLGNEFMESKRVAGTMMDETVRYPLTDELAQQIRTEVEAKLQASGQIPKEWVNLGIHYAKSREDVKNKRDAIAYCDAVVFGYALRDVEAARPDARPLPADAAAVLRGVPDSPEDLLRAILDSDCLRTGERPHADR
jgi:hypothetical protein